MSVRGARGHVPDLRRQVETDRRRKRGERGGGKDPPVSNIDQLC